MDPIIESFEKDLINKLQFKAQSNVSMETVMTKICKFFDLNGAGTLPKQDFLKAVAKVGVTLSDQEVADHVFRYYARGDQVVNYRDFIQQVIVERTSRLPQPQTPTPYQDKIQHLASQGFHQAQTGVVVDVRGQQASEQYT